MIINSRELFSLFHQVLDEDNLQFFDASVDFPEKLPGDKPQLKEARNSQFLQMRDTDIYNFEGKLKNFLENDTAEKNDPYNRISTHINNLKDNKPQAQEHRLAILYILTALNKSKQYKLFNEKNSNLLFNNTVFPDDPTKSNLNLYDYVKKINKLLFEWICGIYAERNTQKTFPDLQDFLYQTIYQFVTRENENGEIIFKPNIYNFLYLFKLLFKEYQKSQLYQVFAKTKLFSLLVTSSKTDIILFDFVRGFIEASPHEALLSLPMLKETLISFFFKLNYQPTVIEIIGEALDNTKEIDSEKQIPHDDLIIVQVIKGIIEGCLKNKDEYQGLINNLYPALLKYFPDYSKYLVEFLEKEDIFTKLANLSIFQKDILVNYLKLLTRMYSKHYEFEHYMLSRKYEIYDILKNYKHELPELTLFKGLIFCSTNECSNVRYIRNYKGIELLTELQPLMNDVYEKNFSEFLLKQSLNTANLLELSSAKVPDFILKRLSKISEENKDNKYDKVAENYLKLYENISSAVFDNSALYKTIEIICNTNDRSSTFKYGNELIKIITNLLEKAKVSKENEKNVEEEPTSFFRLDSDLGSGILGPEYSCGDSFYASFMIRINQLQSNNNSPLPLLTIQNKDNISKIELEILDGKLYLSETTGKGEQLEKIEFKLKTSDSIAFKEGVWQLVHISFTRRKMAKDNIIVTLDNSPDSATVSTKNAIPKNGVLIFGTKSLTENENSTLCDFSTIAITKEKVSRHDLINPDKLNGNDNTLSLLNPINGQGNVIIDACNAKNSKIGFFGRSIPLIPNIYEVVQTVGSLMNIIPLFKYRTKNDKQTTNFYISIIEIFKYMISLTIKVKEIFLESRFFEILSSFLLDDTLNAKYLTYEFVENIYDLYHKLYHIPELRYKMAQYVVLNYYFLKRLNDKVYHRVVNELIPKVIVDENSDSYPFSYIGSFTYQIFSHINALNDSSEKSWNILELMTKHNLKYYRENNMEKERIGCIMDIFHFIFKLRSDYTIIKGLQILNNLIDSGYTEVHNYLRLPDVISEFVSLFSQSEKDIQILALNIIYKIRKVIDLHQVLYQSIQYINIENGIHEELVNAIFDKIIISDNNEIKEFNPDFIPIFSHTSCFFIMEDEEENRPKIREKCEALTNFIQFHTDIAHNIFSVPCWYNYLGILYYVIYNPNIDENDKKGELFLFTTPFQLLLKSDVLNGNFSYLHKFLYSLDFGGKITDTRSIKRIILTAYISNGQLKKEQFLSLYPEIFDLLMIEKNGAFSEKINCSIGLRKITPKNINEEDIELAKVLVENSLTLSNSAKTKINVDDSFTIDLLLASSILASVFLKENTELYIKIIRKIKELFGKDRDQEIEINREEIKVKKLNSEEIKEEELKEKCSVIIVEPFLKYYNEDELRTELDSFYKYIKGDKNKINEVISGKKGAIYRTILNKFASILAHYNKNIQIIIDEQASDYEKNSVDEFMNMNFEEENDLIRQQFDLSLVQSSIANDNKVNVKPRFLHYWLKRKNEYNAEYVITKKIKESYLASLSKTTGPWMNTRNLVSNYKAFNCISKKGQRVLLKINNNFNSHKNAKFKLNEKRAANEKNEVTYTMPYIINEHVDEYYLQINQFNATIQKISATYEGVIKFTGNSFTFMTSSQEEYLDTVEKLINIKFENILFILNRRYVRTERACEVFLDNYKSYFIIFPSSEERNRFYDEIDRFFDNKQQIPQGKKYDFFVDLRNHCKSIHQVGTSQDLFNKLDIEKKWQNRIITNYEYLYYLNMLGGRSFNYPNLYPIFPVFIKNYEGESFDLTSDANYRDLQLPTMRLKPNIFEAFIQEYSPKDGIESLCHTLPFNGFYPALLLLRVEPFTTLNIKINNNKFDDPNRQFYSVKSAFYDQIYTDISKSFYETIPEVLTLPSMMNNENKFNLGVRYEDPKIAVDNVILPPWSIFKGEEKVNNPQLLNSYIFASVNRIAFESDFVSTHLHKWIELYFKKGRGIYTEGSAIFKKSYQMYPSYAYPEKNKVKDYHPDLESFGMLPEVLFNSDHKVRAQHRSKEVPNVLPQINDKVSSMNKGVICCQNKTIYDVYAPEPPFQLPITIGDLQGVARYNKKCLAFFNTKVNTFITVVDLTSKKLAAHCHISSIVKSVCVVNSKYVIVGGSDCSLSFYEIVFNNDNFSINLMTTTGYHSSEVVAVGGCYDNGLAVSLDQKNHLIFETIKTRKFIKYADLNSEEFAQPEQYKNIDNNVEDTEIYVYKSGIVAIVQKNRVIFLDCHGNILFIYYPSECNYIVETRKYYDWDTRELLLISYCIGKQVLKVNVFDLTTFKSVDSYGFQDGYDHFCPIKNTQSFIYSNNNELKAFSFDTSISTEITP